MAKIFPIDFAKVTTHQLGTTNLNIPTCCRASMNIFFLSLSLGLRCKSGYQKTLPRNEFSPAPAWPTTDLSGKNDHLMVSWFLSRDISKPSRFYFCWPILTPFYVFTCISNVQDDVFFLFCFFNVGRIPEIVWMRLCDLYSHLISTLGGSLLVFG